MLVVDPRDWLDPESDRPRRILPDIDRMQAPTERQAVPWLLTVGRGTDDSPFAFCPECGADELMVHEWQGTEWSDPW